MAVRDHDSDRAVPLTRQRKERPIQGRCTIQGGNHKSDLQCFRSGLRLSVNDGLLAWHRAGGGEIWIPIRRSALSVLWRLVAPVRLYLRVTPITKGKGRIAWAFLRPVLRLADQSAGFVWRGGPAGARFHLRYSEQIGAHIAMFGFFERAEVESLMDALVAGTSAIDVGANVGIFTIPLALRAAPSGRVFAIEPYAPNVARLLEHLELNGVANAELHEVAAGASDGTAELQLSDDPACPSTTIVPRHAAAQRTLTVPQRRLDSMWHAAGRPQIGVVKIDVEGSEVTVLEGALDLIRICRPVLLVETWEHLRSLENLLEPLGYRRSQPRGFQRWNHLFAPMSLVERGRRL